MSLLQLNKVVYRHRKIDDGEVFYVGIGTKKRPYTKDKRSSFWNNIVNKHGYKVEILAENISFEDAKDIERLLIKEYGRLDLGTGTLCNLTDGGEGTANVTPEVKKRMSEKRKGIRNIPIGHKRSEEFKLKVSLSKKGCVSNFKGKKHTEETKAIIKEKRAKQIFSAETLIKKSNSMKGDKNPASKKILNTQNNIIFNTMKDAAKSVGISYTTLSAMLNGHSSNKTNLIKLENYEFTR
jgi:group I intron endonuclease